MKKFLCILSVMMIVMGLGITSASADSYRSFSLGVQCTDENGPCTTMPGTYVGPKQNTTDRRVQVSYTVSGGSNAYTNMFHVVRDDGKWVQSKFVEARGTYLPIIGTASAIPAGRKYKLAARGNTKHWDNDGISNVTLNGSLFVN